MREQQSISQLRRQSEAPSESSQSQGLEEVPEAQAEEEAEETTGSERKTTPRAQEALQALEDADDGPTGSEAV
jgi:hypothetical protein